MEVDPIDFDPTTEEGREDINKTVEDEYYSLLQQEGETNKSWHSRLRQKFGPDGLQKSLRSLSEAFKRFNPGKQLPEFMEFQNMDELKEIVDAKQSIREIYKDTTFDDLKFKYEDNEVRLKVKYNDLRSHEKKMD